MESSSPVDRPLEIADSLNKLMNEQWTGLPLIRDAMTRLWRHVMDSKTEHKNIDTYCCLG